MNRLPVLATIVLSLAPTALAQKATYIPLPETIGANDMTPDGRIVVGDAFGGTGYYYTEEAPEKWNGQLPQVSGGDAIPLLNIGAMSQVER